MSDEYLGLGLRGGETKAPEAAEMEFAQRIGLENRLKSGANWCFWIAGLSLVNTIASFTGSEWRFAAALGVTQVVDAIGMVVAQNSPDAAMAMHVIVILADLGAAACFVLLGLFARQKRIWAFVTAMALYGTDSLIVLWARDVMGIVIHAVALVGLYGGMKACRRFLALPASSS